MLVKNKVCFTILIFICYWIGKDCMNDKKFDLINSNDYGRRFTIRFKQYEYTEPIDNSNWIIKNNGCGPTSLATILASFGYDVDPILISKKMLFNEHGFLSNGYFEGINGVSIIYCLNKLIDENMNIEYKIVKINYDDPKVMKQTIIDMINDGFMAMIGVGPHPNVFAKDGHYIVLTSVNKKNNEFYVSNSWYEGDNQIDITFSYEQIVKDIYRDNFDFLMIRKKN